MEHHSQESHWSRTLGACATCHERKLKCDDRIPCGSCARNSTDCSRIAPSQESVTPDLRTSTSNERGDGYDVSNGDHPMLMNDISKTNETSTKLPRNDRLQSCFQSGPENWTPPSPDTGANVPYYGFSNSSSLVPYAASASQRGHDDSVTPITGPRYYFLNPPLELWSDQSPHEVYQPNRLMPSHVNESQVSSKFVGRGRLYDLRITLTENHLKPKGWFSCILRRSTHTGRSCTHQRLTSRRLPIS